MKMKAAAALALAMMLAIPRLALAQAAVTDPSLVHSGVDINSAGQVTSGTHLGAATVPYSALPALDFWGTPWQAGSPGTYAIAAAANTYTTWSSFDIPVRVGPWSHLCVKIGTADATGYYDFALFNSAGAMVADTGAIHVPSTGDQCFSIVHNASCTAAGAPSPCCTGNGTGTCPSSVTISPGRYLVVTTGTGTTATLYRGNAGVLWSGSSYADTQGSTSNGVLPASVAPPAVAPQLTNGLIPCVALY